MTENLGECSQVGYVITFLDTLHIYSYGASDGAHGKSGNTQGDNIFGTIQLGIDRSCLQGDPGEVLGTFF